MFRSSFRKNKLENLPLNKKEIAFRKQLVKVLNYSIEKILSTAFFVKLKSFMVINNSNLKDFLKANDADNYLKLCDINFYDYCLNTSGVYHTIDYDKYNEVSIIIETFKKQLATELTNRKIKNVDIITDINEEKCSGIIYITLPHYNVTTIEEITAANKIETEVNAVREGFIQDSSPIKEYEKAPLMKFADNETEYVQSSLDGGMSINVTRIAPSGKYKKGQIYRTPWDDQVRIVRVQEFNSLKEHPAVESLLDWDRRQIVIHTEKNKKPYQYLTLEKYIPANRYDEGNVSDEEVLESMQDVWKYYNKIENMQQVYDNAQFEINNKKYMVSQYTDSLKMIRETAMEAIESKADITMIDTLLDELDDMITNEGTVLFSDDQRIPVYLVLIRSKSPLSTMINFFTGDDYTHASITFDSSMETLYTFGVKPDDPNILHSGFAVDNYKDPKWKGIKTAIYVTFVTKPEFNKMKELLEVIARKDMKFNMKGIIKNGFMRLGMNVNPETKDKFFCSEFVSTLLNSSRQMTVNPAAKTAPNDLQYNENFYPVFKGFMEDYNQKYADLIVRSIRKEYSLKK